jgi:hypothetical protein
MKVSALMRLFRVDTGDPDAGTGFITFSSGNKSYFVVANDYQDAVEKVISFMQNFNHDKSVVDADGSLTHFATGGEIKIKSVNLVTDQLIL